MTVPSSWCLLHPIDQYAYMINIAGYSVKAITTALAFDYSEYPAILVWWTQSGPAIACMQAQIVSTKLTSYVTHVSVQVCMIDALFLLYLIWYAATIIGLAYSSQLGLV